MVTAAVAKKNRRKKEIFQAWQKAHVDTITKKYVALQYNISFYDL